MESRPETDFNILGFNVRFNPQTTNLDVDAKDIVDYVTREAELIAKKAPSLNPGQVAILVALKLGAEKMTLEDHFQYSVDRFEKAATDAMEYIEEVSSQR